MVHCVTQNNMYCGFVLFYKIRKVFLPPPPPFFPSSELISTLNTRQRRQHCGMSMVAVNCVWIFVKGAATMTTYCFYRLVHFYFPRDKTHS
jgi:hypothetical protein